METVVKGTDVQVRVFTLAPGETIPWHFHHDSTDYYFVRLLVRIQFCDRIAGHLGVSWQVVRRQNGPRATSIFLEWRDTRGA